MTSEEAVPDGLQLTPNVRMMVANSLHGIVQKWLEDQGSPPEEAHEILNKLDIASMDDPASDQAYQWAVTRALRHEVISKDELNERIKGFEEMDQTIEKRIKEI